MKYKISFVIFLLSVFLFFIYSRNTGRHYKNALKTTNNKQQTTNKLKNLLIN